MKDEFKQLDSEKATLRLIYCLAYECPSCSRTELRSCLRKYGVGGTAFMASLETLKKLGLIVEKRIGEGRTVTATSLTEKGIRTAEMISELYDNL